MEFATLATGYGLLDAKVQPVREELVEPGNARAATARVKSTNLAGVARVCAAQP